MWFRLFRRDAEAAKDAALGIVPEGDGGGDASRAGEPGEHQAGGGDAAAGDVPQGEGKAGERGADRGDERGDGPGRGQGRRRGAG